MHLRVDCIGQVGNEALLLDPDKLKAALGTLADAARMHAFGKPQVVECPFPYPHGGVALSAVLFLGESAIVVHTWPEKKTLWIDIFHCFPFDVSNAIESIKNIFGLGEEGTFIDLCERGVDEEGDPVPTRQLHYVPRGSLTHAK